MTFVIMEVDRKTLYGRRVHLIRQSPHAKETGHYVTACGFNVLPSMPRKLAKFPWVGKDKCRACRRSLEAGSLGWTIGT